MQRGTRQLFEQLTEDWQSTREIVLKLYPDAYSEPHRYRIHIRIMSRLQKLAREGLIEKQPGAAYTSIKNWVWPQRRRCTKWRNIEGGGGG